MVYVTLYNVKTKLKEFIYLYTTSPNVVIKVKKFKGESIGSNHHTINKFNFIIKRYILI
jgi:hypothetical protein